ncbi:MAG: MATE family efflux transporter [Blautia sp.]|nr:MATE family efflux transporter [Blautia sp.]
MENRSDNPMLTGVIWKQILLFFFPILIGAFFQQLYNTVDAVVVGRFAGKEALASVGGSSGQILGFIFSFFMGLSTGATVIIAQAFGASHPERVDDALHTSYTFGAAGGILLGGLGFLFTRPLLSLLRTPEDLMPGSVVYVRILMAGLVFTLIYNMCSGILRAIGDSRRPLYVLIACCLLNIVLDVLFVAGMHLGVLGAAIATVLCQAFSAVVTTWLLMTKTPSMTLSLRKLRIRPKVLKKILTIGLPTALAGSMFSISNMILQTAINRMGIDEVAAWTAYGKMDALWWMVNQAFSTSITTFVGQNYGAGLADRVKKGIREVLLMEILTALSLTLLMLTAGPYLLRLFTNDADVIRLGMVVARILTPFYAVFAIAEITGSALRAEGHVMVNTVSNLLGICVFRIIWVTFVYPSGTFRQIMACYPISWVLITIFISGYFLLKQKKILAKLHPKNES